MSALILAVSDGQKTQEKIEKFCADFCKVGGRPRYVFGRNVYTEAIFSVVDVDGVIDDYFQGDEYLGKPVITTDQVPENALVLVASGGRPLTVKKKMEELGIESLDYFAFLQYSGLPLKELVFNEGFAQDFDDNREKYEQIFEMLADDESKQLFQKLVSFRLKHDLELLEGFSYREPQQYYEDFLELQEEGESFADIGGFDGSTSMEFIKRCPQFKSIHLFEPDPKNYEVSKTNLAPYDNAYVYNLGLSDKKQTLRFDIDGSGSHISEDGELEISVDRYDDVVDDQITFMKMDIEGAELSAIAGAAKTIKQQHPRLAICIYHGDGHFWRVPEKVLAIRDDYKLYLRHYTESIYETVMFFMPIK